MQDLNLRLPACRTNALAKRCGPVSTALQTTFGLSPRPDLPKGIILGNYFWPCKGQVSRLDAGPPHLRVRRVCCVKDAGQSIAMCTSVIVRIKAITASTIQEVEELARELGPANAIVPHQKSSAGLADPVVPQ